MSPTTVLPSLIGVIHLPPLPHSPRYASDLSAIADGAARDAMHLAEAGFDGVMVENFGDAPFCPTQVDAATVACMTRCALAVRQVAPRLQLGINVLRNDVHSALGIAVAVDAALVRVNVHSGARLTDQGIIEGQAYASARRRAVLMPSCKLFCDVGVKHSAPLATRDLVEEAVETGERGLADALLVTGWGTGHAPDSAMVEKIAAAVDQPVFVASGATVASVGALSAAYGVIVGSTLRANGRAGGPIDADAAKQFADAWHLTRDRKTRQ